jgi:hypothetical protein
MPGFGASFRTGESPPQAAWVPPWNLWMNFNGWTQQALGALVRPGQDGIRNNTAVYNTMGQRVTPRGKPRPPMLQPSLKKAHTATFTLAGVSRDATGAALGFCEVYVLGSDDKLVKAQTISDGSGNYSVTLANNQPVWPIMYKTGSPDVAGAGLNTLVPV